MTILTGGINGNDEIEERLIRLEAMIAGKDQPVEWWKMFSSVVAAVSIIVGAIIGFGNWALAQQLRPLYLKLDQQEKSISAVADEVGKLKDRIADVRERVAAINNK